MHQPRALIILLTLLLAAPAASAAWIHKGLVEPDTKYDREDGYMFAGPDWNVSGRQVYLNGITTYCSTVYVCLTLTTFNPNVGVLQTRHSAYPTTFMALFGVWKDCNKDGYVGYGEPGILEYRVQLLPADHVCPASFVTPSKNWNPVHNNGVWVRELLPIGWDDTNTPADANPWDFNDTSARVWIDWNRPADPIQRLCFVAAWPDQSMRKVGGIIGGLDCHTGFKILGTINTVAHTVPGMGGYAFDDARKDRPQDSSSPLNRDNPWGEPDRTKKEPVVDAFDCTRPVGPKVNVPTQGQRGLAMPHAPPRVNAQGSIGAAVNETDQDTDDCDFSDEETQNGSLGDAAYNLEQSGENYVDIRREPDHVLTYAESARNGPVNTFLGGGSTDAGLGTVHAYGLWYSGVVTGVSRNPYVNRDTLQPMGVTYITTYAYTGLGDRVTLPLGTKPFGSYGSEACALGEESPFECDPDLWYPGDQASSIPRENRLGRDPDHPSLYYPIDVRVGDPYNMRDIDCYDETIGPLRHNALGQPIGPYSLISSPGTGACLT